MRNNHKVINPALAGFFIFLCVLGFSSLSSAQTNSPVMGSPFDLQGSIDKEIQEGKVRIVIPPGCYRVTPHNGQHLMLHGLKDVSIIADGVEMICTETTRALTISDCTNVMVRGLTIDYDPLPFTQGRITAFAADKKFEEVELFEGYPPASSVYNFKFEIFRPDTRTLRCSDRYVSGVEVEDARHLKILTPNEHEDSPEQIGDIVVIGSQSSTHGNIAHAIVCERDVRVRLDNVGLYASNCFGFLESDCYGTTYDHCWIDRCPPEKDPVKRADPRVRSLDADAFHSVGATKGPAYLGCRAGYMGDDCVNIHGDYQMIMAVNGRQLRVLAKGHMNIELGDPVELENYEGVRLPEAMAVSVQPDGEIHEDEKDFLSRQRLNENMKSAHGLMTHAYLITLDRAVDLPRGSVICAANRVGNGFLVTGCHFGFNRSRGILIKASNGEVSNNDIEDSWMSAILVTPEYWWMEAGSSSDVRITGNTISGCGGVPICVEAMGGDGQISPAGAHRNIAIEENTITNCTMPGILVTSTTGLRVGKNNFNLRVDAKHLPDLMRKAGSYNLEPVVELECQP